MNVGGFAKALVRKRLEDKLKPLTDIRDAWKAAHPEVKENPTPAMREANRKAVNEKKGLNRDYPGKGKR